MSRISIDHSPPRPCKGKKTLRRHRGNEEADDIILIDVDSDNFDDVIIIDISESLPEKTQGSSMLGKGKWPFRNVINIDDDETPENSPFIEVNNVGFSGGTSSNRDSAIPVRLSKCKRTYSGKALRRNRYGLNTDSECDSSDDDYPDCELVEDSSGKVREQWEKASSRRRKDVHNGNLGIRDETRRHKEVSFCFPSGKSNNENDASFYFRYKMDTDLGGTHLSDDDAIYNKQNKKSDARDQSNSQAKSSSPFHVEEADYMDYEPGYSSSNIKEMDKNPASSFREEPSKKFNHAIPIVEDEETFEVGPSPQESDLFVDEDSCNGKSSHTEGDNIHEAKLQEDNSMSSIEQKENKDGKLDSENGDACFPEETCLISEREKLKETDEYKRAVEEEWASRQQALLIQAEEARHLRRLHKRRKAESMRLLDMERRQKERIEEMRNIQKKDEENMNLKETIRSEVRNELKKLEIQCKNMASLLHLLGIRVSGWPNPPPQEVQTAYKRALLTFHPDRARQSDIKQQVEAEEKFKLINRVKEKLPPC